MGPLRIWAVGVTDQPCLAFITLILTLILTISLSANYGQWWSGVVGDDFKPVFHCPME